MRIAFIPLGKFRPTCWLINNLGLIRPTAIRSLWIGLYEPRVAKEYRGVLAFGVLPSSVERGRIFLHF